MSGGMAPLMMRMMGSYYPAYYGGFDAVLVVAVIVKQPRFGNFRDEISVIVVKKQLSGELDGTVVLDIKPYWPQYDKVTEHRTPKWVNRPEF